MFYVELRLREVAEISQNVAVSIVFGKVHSFIGRNQLSTVGVSFPKIHRSGIGDIIRVFGCQDEMDRLVEFFSKLPNIRNYVQISSVQAVPQTNQSVSYARIQPRSPSSVRRAIKRGNFISENYKPTEAAYVIVKSSSTGQRISLFIRPQISNSPIGGKFNSYGIGSNSFVPFF